MEGYLDNIYIALVNPKDSKNIGAVCRAMKTMNIRNLIIVKKREIDEKEIKRIAIHAFDVFERACFYSNLEEALKIASLAVGFTRRRGKRRKYFSLTPEELSKLISCHRRGRVIAVFGNEESGLTDKELSLCNVAVKIPTSPIFPSLNLSHAVQIITYQIFRHQTQTFFPDYTPISNEKIKDLTMVIIKSLKNIGFFSQGDPEELRFFFKDILSRAYLSGRESKRIETIFRKISGLIVKRGIGPL